VWTKWLSIIGHYSEELLFVDFPILVKVKFVYHCLSRYKGYNEHNVSAGTEQAARMGEMPGSTSTIDLSLRQASGNETHSSSSSNRSPISFATLRKFRKLIFPVLSSSKRWNARRISSIGSRASMRSLTNGAEIRVKISGRARCKHPLQLCNTQLILAKSSKSINPWPLLS
jgi:hypothetical protein